MFPQYPTRALGVLLLVASAFASPSGHLSNLFLRQEPSPDSNSTIPTTSPKAGLAWPNGGASDIRQFAVTGKVSWYYTWSAWPTRSNLEFVPMLWGLKSVEQFAANWRSNLARGDVKAVLGMNEPQQKGQADMTPEDGAVVWKTYLEPLRAQGIRLGSPAPSSAPSGKTWLLDFFAACAESCTVDFMALHWYGTNAAHFIAYVEDMHATFSQRPVWVTEWACHNFNPASPDPSQCTPEQVRAFLNETQAWMDATEWVERYAWFGAMREDAMNDVNPDNAMMDKEGKINALGRQYIAAAEGVVYSNAGWSPQWDVHAASLLFISVAVYML